jgi:hypothetical protein
MRYKALLMFVLVATPVSQESFNRSSLTFIPDTKIDVPMTHSPRLYAI